MSSSFYTHDVCKLRTGWYYILADSAKGCLKQLSKANKTYVVDPSPIVEQKDFANYKIYRNRDGLPGLAIYFDRIGTIAWAGATYRSIGLELGFVLNDTLISTVRINSKITEGVSSIMSPLLTEENLKDILSVLLEK
ncbi:MAG: hypothetical protein EOO88_57265 [Pedobacter sp.]|nr:MAG: hypothetical protein EOO88_57265 [Pedobacter sp.]